MCGIAGYYRLPVALEQRRGLLDRMIGTLAHRGPDGNGIYVDGDVGLGARAPQHHRRRRRPPADVQRGRHGLDHLQRRDLQLRRAARRADRPRPQLQDHLRHRGHRPSLRGARAGLRHGAQRRLRLRHLGCARSSAWCMARDRAGVRPLYYAVRDGAIAFASEVKALLEVPGISAAPDPIALDQMFTFWFPLGAAHAVQGHRRAAAGARAYRQRARHHEQAVLALRISGRRRRSSRVAGRGGAHHRRGARAAARCRAHPLACRRADRRLPQRRARFLDHHGGHPQLRARPAPLVLGRVRDRRVRRKRIPARDGRRARPEAFDRRLPRRRHRRRAAGAHPPHRAADHAHGAGAACSCCRGWCATTASRW